MNNIFNLKRFAWLLKKTLLERPAQMFGFTGLLLTLVFILYYVAKTLAGFGAAQNLSFIWGLPVGSCLLASIVFGYFSSNAMGSSFLTLPASNFEKWLCGILISCVLYPAIFLIFYRIVDGTFVTAYHNRLDTSSPFYKQQYEAVYIFSFTGIVAWKVYQTFFFFTGAMLVGSLYFNKIPFIKSAISICILTVGIVGINWLMAKLFFGNFNDAGAFNHVTIPVGKEEATVELPSAIGNIFTYSIWFIIPGILWILSYTRLREKEF
ncbi:MAG: hypothetical protein M3Z92_11790 [Bacteroidota bacterium]|nr:hypothetical protein [Bacteroidota bacterium]